MTTFFVSDTHFGHKNFLTFKNDAGKPIRDFETVEAMDEYLVAQWNSVVGRDDLVWHLGDVVWSRETARRILPRLKGRKRLILGNHDDLAAHDLLAYFQDVQLWRNFSTEGFVCSHLPLRDETLRDGAINVHGHIHEKASPTPRHINICVERMGYTPVALDTLAEMVRFRREQHGL